MIELKPVELTDARIIFEAWGRYPENFRCLTARVFVGLDDARHYIEALFQTPESKAFHILSPDGVVGIVKASISGHRAQIGYVVHEAFRGKGLATTAVKELTARLEAMPGISRIRATCALDNVASSRVLEKNGFEREAILRNWVVYPAQGASAHDNYSYVKVPGRSR